MYENNGHEKDPIQPHLPGIDPAEFSAVLSHPSMRFYVDNDDIASSREVIESALHTLAASRRLKVISVNDVPRSGNLSGAQVLRFF